MLNQGICSQPSDAETDAAILDLLTVSLDPWAVGEVEREIGKCDEIWAYCYAKRKNVPEQHKGTFGYGNVWTWTALCADTKLVPSWLIGERNTYDAIVFMNDLSGRLSNRVQLTTDGASAYGTAISIGFGQEIDYAELHKIYGPGPDGEGSRCYSPAGLTGTKKIVKRGNPDLGKVSTSYVERQNLTMRMGMRRFTRLTNRFSRKVENPAHAVSLHFMHYNFPLAPDASDDPGDGCWGGGSPLELGRHRSVTRLVDRFFQR